MKSLSSLLPVAVWLTASLFASHAESEFDPAGNPALTAKPSRHGPFRHDPSQPVPKHAYSPFDELKAPTPYTPVPGRDYEDGELVIKFAPDVAVHGNSGAGLAGPRSGAALTGQGSLNRVLAAHGITRLDAVFPNAHPPVQTMAAKSGVALPDLTRWFRAKTSGATATAVEALTGQPGIEVVEPDYLRKLADGPTNASEPAEGGPDDPSHTGGRQGAGLMGGGGIMPGPDTDPLYAQQWHLAAARLPEAWAYLEGQGLPPGGNRDIVVAVIDTGVDYTHPDLAANMWVNSREIPGNGIDDDNNGFVDDVHGCTVVSDPRSHSGDPQDDHGHGTHVAGIIAAQAGNHEGGAGVACNAQIISIKAAQYSGVLTSSDIAEGVHYAVANGAEIINMSFGGYTRSQIEEDALAVAFAQCVLVAAAGNDGGTEQCGPPGPIYPAAYNWVLGVMASTPSGGLAGFSNRDCRPRDSLEYEVMAPGVDILSTFPNSQYVAWDGTSMATPIVSGIAALARTQWSDKDVYSSRFIMGQISGRKYPMENLVDALETLTIPPKPELSYLEHWTFDTPLQAANNDSDGVVDAGETIDLAIVIRNHWGQASNVVGVLEAWADGAFQPDPYVTWLTNTVNFGAVGSFNIDDNGFIYTGDVITGVRHPFRFCVTNTCPNDHVIPLKLTLTGENGLDPTDKTTYSSVSRFVLIVQRGRELPRIISQDMTLTKDDYWLLPDATLIEAGATVTVTEGTQIQFWSGDPNDPYHGNPNAYLQVEGNFIVNGSVDDPVDLFQWSLFPGKDTRMRERPSGRIWLNYARVRNPAIESSTAIDHCYFYPDAFDFGYGGAVASIISHSISHKLAWWGVGRGVGERRWGNLYDSCQLILYDTIDIHDSVLLKNYKLARTQWGDRQYLLSKAERCGTIIDPVSFVRALFPTNVTFVQGDKTYFLLPMESSFDQAEQFARFYGGHLASIGDEAENEFLRTYREQYVTGANFSQLYPSLTGWNSFQGGLTVGLSDRDVEGVFVWSSGEPLIYTNWAPGEPNNWNGQEDYVVMNGQWSDTGGGAGPWVCEVPGIWDQAQIDARRQEFLLLGSFNTFTRNAILNVWWDPDINHWLKFEVWVDRSKQVYLTGNYWGTTATTLIDAAIIDYNDDFNVARCIYKPPLSEAPETCFPFVVDVRLSTAAGPNVSIVGAEPVTFTVTFNRDMNTSIQPMVTFGPDVPYTDYTSHPVGGGWHDARTWIGTFHITPITGDGYQFIRVADAVAADDPWLVTGDDSERFRFEIITSGTESMNLQATGGEGRVELSWMQDDFELLAGYQLYRSTSAEGEYTRINQALLPAHIRRFTDTEVEPGRPYYYKFTVVQTSMAESDFSNMAEGTPLDTIPPTLSHTPIASATPGLPLTLSADVTDNVSVQGVLLFFRATGGSSYTSRAMTRTASDRYTGTIEASRIASPGVDYYIEATDGVSVKRSGRPDLPWRISVNDRPVVTVVTPNQGPSGGGTAVTIAGANFKTGAKVRFGEVPATDVVVVSASQILCTAPPHYPAIVDVTVSDASGQSGSLLRAFTYRSETVSLGLPATGGGRLSIVEVPVTAANASGLGAATFTVTFDALVLKPLGARAGSLTPGWSVAANTDTAGQVRVSMASPGGTSTGSGVLARLDFEVLGAPGAVTALQLIGVSLNDGAIPVETGDGTFAVSAVYSVIGRVAFWNQSRPVPGVELALVGARTYTGSSGTDGTYAVAGAESGSYVLTPAKPDGATAITGYDASLALQHDAGLAPLGGHAATAADVDKTRTITSMDAFYILQRAVDLLPVPFPGAGVVWEFSPVNRSYANLSGNQSGQDFTAILLGDVSGNWPTGGGGLMAAHGGARTADGSVADPAQEQPARPGRSQASLMGDPPGPVVLSVKHRVSILSYGSKDWLLAKSPVAQIYSLDLVLTNASGASVASGVELGSVAETLAMAVNTNQPGVVRVSLAGATPIGGVGAFLTVLYGGGDPPSPWQIERASVNEGAVEVVVDAEGATFEADTDEDGQSDWEEVLAGTDPTQSSSRLALEQVSLDTAGRPVLSWSSVAGRTYQIEAVDAMGAAAWGTLGAPVLASGATTAITDATAPSSKSRFYRIRLVE